jgi:hypothetical protein
MGIYGNRINGGVCKDKQNFSKSIKLLNKAIYIMPFKPLINLRTTTIAKAFFINAIVLSVIAACSIELRRYLDSIKETKKLSRLQKIIITISGTFFIGVIVYILARISFGFGGGMLDTQPFSKKLI